VDPLQARFFGTSDVSPTYGREAFEAPLFLPVFSRRREVWAGRLAMLGFAVAAWKEVGVGVGGRGCGGVGVGVWVGVGVGVGVGVWGWGGCGGGGGCGCGGGDSLRWHTGTSRSSWTPSILRASCTPQPWYTKLLCVPVAYPQVP
jgi:hypothetical protein